MPGLTKPFPFPFPIAFADHIDQVEWFGLLRDAEVQAPRKPKDTRKLAHVFFQMAKSQMANVFFKELQNISEWFHGFESPDQFSLQGFQSDVAATAVCVVASTHYLGHTAVN